MTEPILNRVTDAASPETERRLWFALLAPFAAWTVDELAGYAIAARACAVTADRLGTWSTTALIVLNVACIGVCVAAIISGRRVFREWSPMRHVREAEGWNRVEFMAMAAIFVASVLLANIVMFGLVPALSAPCENTR